MPPVQIGGVIRSAGLATIVKVGELEGCRLKPGDIVSCLPGKLSCIQYPWRAALLMNRLGGVRHQAAGAEGQGDVRVVLQQASRHL